MSRKKFAFAVSANFADKSLSMTCSVKTGSCEMEEAGRQGCGHDSSPDSYPSI